MEKLILSVDFKHILNKKLQMRYFVQQKYSTVNHDITCISSTELLEGPYYVKFQHEYAFEYGATPFLLCGGESIFIYVYTGMAPCFAMV